ncbi:hypothetical protein C1646_688442 [Rhizophagus diaphanus]|nr:hypothetical protein C1646_688442 [Rhizophagus diaphanus] [Rhizophagus sp. MUCL 43196]
MLLFRFRVIQVCHINFAFLFVFIECVNTNHLKKHEVSVILNKEKFWPNFIKMYLLRRYSITEFKVNVIHIQYVSVQINTR